MRVRKDSRNLPNGKRNRQKSQIKKLQHKPLTKYRNRQVNPPILGLPCLFFTCLPFSFAILAVWIQGALSRRSGNRCFRIARNKQIIRTRPPQGRTGSDYIGLVPLTGLEPVRILLRGILSPLCLPIPPQRRADSKIYLPMIQYFPREVKRLLILLHLSRIDKKMNLADNKKKDFYKEALL